MAEDKTSFEWEPGKELDAKKVAAAKCVLSEIISIIKNHYEPTTSEDDTAIRMSTIEIFNRIYSFSPGEYTPDIVFDMLRESGFKFEVASSTMDFNWLLKEK